MLKFPYHDGDTRIDAPADTGDGICQAGPIDHHWTKNAVASADGSKLYVSIGSNSNVAENGIAAEDRARGDLGSGFAKTGEPPHLMRVGCAIRTAWRWEPKTGALWTAVNERDELGSDLVPDYMTSVKDGGFYGWPYSPIMDSMSMRAHSRSGRIWWRRPSCRTTR